MNIVNKYRLKNNSTIEDIIKELKEKKLPISENGTYINKEAKYSTFKNLVDDIEVCIAFPDDLSKWNDFDFVLVLDEAFGQPYQPFYTAAENKNRRFAFVLNVIGHYNKFMNTLSFLEKIPNNE